RVNANGTVTFKGSYMGNSSLYNGLSLNEVYLMKAEANARRNNIEVAMASLNTLLEKRWVAGTFTPSVISSKEEALQLILAERRKELLMRGLRWIDIKRLNKE